jgi:hypothetical protein
MSWIRNTGPYLSSKERREILVVFTRSDTGVPGSFSSATSCSRPRLFSGKGDSGSRVKEEEEEDEKESVPGPYSAVLRSSSERAKVRPSVGPECVEQFPILVILIVHIFSRKCALVKARQLRNRSSRILLLV